jgi:hypothetical protein
MWQFSAGLMTHGFLGALQRQVQDPTWLAGNDLPIELRRRKFTRNPWKSGRKWQFSGAISSIRPQVYKTLSALSHRQFRSPVPR